MTVSPYREAILEAVEVLALDLANALDEGDEATAQASLATLKNLSNVPGATARAMIRPTVASTLARYSIPIAALDLDSSEAGL